MSLNEKFSVPWYSWHMLKDVYDDIYSCDIYKQQNAVHTINGWRVRQKVPVAIDMSGIITEIKLLDGYFNESMTGKRGDIELRLMYSMAIVRLVNGLVDNLQDKQYAQSISLIAKKIDLCEELVDVRHQATHHYLPSLSTLRLAIEIALKQLARIYWLPQLNILRAHLDNPEFDKLVLKTLRSFSHNFNQFYIPSNLLQNISSFFPSSSSFVDFSFFLNAERIHHTSGKLENISNKKKEIITFVDIFDLFNYTSIYINSKLKKNISPKKIRKKLGLLLNYYMYSEDVIKWTLNISLNFSKILINYNKVIEADFDESKLLSYICEYVIPFHDVHTYPSWGLVVYSTIALTTYNFTIKMITQILSIVFNLSDVLSNNCLRLSYSSDSSENVVSFDVNHTSTANVYKEKCASHRIWLWKAFCNVKKEMCSSEPSHNIKKKTNISNKKNSYKEKEDIEHDSSESSKTFVDVRSNDFSSCEYDDAERERFILSSLFCANENVSINRERFIEWIEFLLIFPNLVMKNLNSSCFNFFVNNKRKQESEEKEIGKNLGKENNNRFKNFLKNFNMKNVHNNNNNNDNNNNNNTNAVNSFCNSENLDDNNKVSPLKKRKLEKEDDNLSKDTRAASSGSTLDFSSFSSAFPLFVFMLFLNTLKTDKYFSVYLSMLTIARSRIIAAIKIIATDLCKVCIKCLVDNIQNFECKVEEGEKSKCVQQQDSEKSKLVEECSKYPKSVERKQETLKHQLHDKEKKEKSVVVTSDYDCSYTLGDIKRRKKECGLGYIEEEEEVFDYSNVRNLRKFQDDHDDAVVSSGNENIVISEKKKEKKAALVIDKMKEDARIVTRIYKILQKEVVEVVPSESLEIIKTLIHETQHLLKNFYQAPAGNIFFLDAEREMKKEKDDNIEEGKVDKEKLNASLITSNHTSEQKLFGRNNEEEREDIIAKYYSTKLKLDLKEKHLVDFSEKFHHQKPRKKHAKKIFLSTQQQPWLLLGTFWDSTNWKLSEHVPVKGFCCSSDDNRVDRIEDNLLKLVKKKQPRKVHFRCTTATASKVLRADRSASLEESFCGDPNETEVYFSGSSNHGIAEERSDGLHCKSVYKKICDYVNNKNGSMHSSNSCWSEAISASLLREDKNKSNEGTETRVEDESTENIFCFLNMDEEDFCSSSCCCCANTQHEN